MTYSIKAYTSFPCALEVFTINNKNAYIDDFGGTEDLCKAAAEPWSCANMQFVRNDYLKKDTMAKYSLTEDEYETICKELENTLAVGSCGLCV